ncbi:MAG: patatin-like phospholipase family protein [Pseudomonadales bacterium]
MSSKSAGLSGRPKIGLALGSGAARGLAHIGVIRALQRYRLTPDIVCGSSIGAFMGAAYAMDKLDDVEEWLSGMSTYELIKQMDIRLLAGSGIADGDNLMRFATEKFGNPNIEDLRIPFAAVATDMKSGRELWLREGPVWQAARASMALPGMLTPSKIDGRWLLDGGLVNPVPVSVCKALGADIIIAVNLNGDLVSREQVVLHDDSDLMADLIPDAVNETELASALADNAQVEGEAANFFEKLSVSIRERTTPIIEQWMSPSEETPGLFNVVTNSINIMQDRITRSRLAGEPADLVLTPRLNHIGMMEFTRAAEIISEGEKCVERMNAVIEHRLGVVRK